jgi:putative spermidine/putrescine transport system substrate-binding protein
MKESVMSSMKGLKLKVLCVLSVAAAVTVTTSVYAQSDAAGEINVAGYAAIYQDNFTKAVIEPFMKKYPNIKVNYVPTQLSAERLGALRAQKDNPQLDIALMDVALSRIAIDEGLFAEIDPVAVPNLKDLYDNARPNGKYGPALTFDHITIIYRKDLLPAAPKSWTDLWDPKYSGQVIVNAPPNIQGLAFTIVVDHLQGADYKKSIDPAIQKLKELAPSVQTWAPRPDGYTVLLTGAAKIGTGWNAQSQMYANRSEGKLGVVLPQEGSVFQIDTMDLVKGSKNPKAAQVFINYAISPEAQESFASTMFYAPTNKNAKVTPEVLARTAAGAESRAKMIPVDWGYVGSVRDQWLERWRREIISAK